MSAAYQSYRVAV